MNINTVHTYCQMSRKISKKDALHIGKEKCLIYSGIQHLKAYSRDSRKAYSRDSRKESHIDVTSVERYIASACIL